MAIAALVVAVALIIARTPSDEATAPPAAAGGATVALPPEAPAPPRLRDRGPSPTPRADPASVVHEQHLAELPEAVLPPFEPESAEHGGWRVARTAELQDLAWETDDASTLTLVAELCNPDPVVRRAALDAITSQGNDHAIPYLEAVAWQSDDPVLQREIEETVDYLEVPALEDVISGRRKAKPVDPDELPGAPAGSTGPATGE